MRKFDLSLRSSRSSYFATFRHQLTILSKTDALDEEKWLNMLGTFVKDWFRYESAGKSYCSRRFGGATCDDKSAQIYARFDKNDWRIQPAEFYRFHDAEVNTFGYF